MSHILKPGECPECDLMPKEIATLRSEVSRLEAEVERLNGAVLALQNMNAGAESALAEARAEVQAFRFYSDEFCQGDETAEQAAHAMFDKVVEWRHRAQAAESQRDRAVEVLRSMEWHRTEWVSDMGRYVDRCPMCHRARGSEHAPECALSALLKEVDRGG